MGWNWEDLQKSSVHPSGDSQDPRVGGGILLHPGGEQGPPPNKLEMALMEVCGEGETTASQLGGDTPLGCKQVSWEEQAQAEEERRPKDNPGKKLPLLPLQNTTPTANTMPPVAPSTSDDGFIMVQGQVLGQKTQGSLQGSYSLTEAL